MKTPARTPARMMTIFMPERVDGRWRTTAVVYTPLGQMTIEAQGSEDLARIALERVQKMLPPAGDEIAGVLEDIQKSIQRVAKSKTFTQVFNTAKGVLKNPLLRGLVGKVPFVSSIVDSADAAFAIVDGVRNGQTDAKSIIANAQRLANSKDPNVARKYQMLLGGLQVAQVASGLFDKVQKGDKSAKQMVRNLRMKAGEGDQKAIAALTAYKKARKFRIREVAATTVRAALSGDTQAQGRIDAIYQGAKSGDKNAREAVRQLKKIVLTTAPATVGGISDDLTLYEREALTVAGNPPYYHLMRAIHDLRQQYVH